MRRTETKYHYAMRSVKRNKDEIIRVRIAETLLSHNDRDFEDEAKELCNWKSLYSNLGDDCYTDADITDFRVYKY